MKRKGNSMVIVIIKKKDYLERAPDLVWQPKHQIRWREGQKEVAAGSPNLLSHGCILEDKGKKRRKEI